jgi:carboxylesterase type B
MAAILNGDKPGLPAGLAVFLPKDFNPMNLMDSIMGCSSASASVIRMKNGVPAWRFRYMGVWKNTDLGPGTGAYHSSDVPIVFGTTELRTGNVKDSSEEAKVVKRMRSSCACRKIS